MRLCRCFAVLSLGGLYGEAESCKTRQICNVSTSPKCALQIDEADISRSLQQQMMRKLRFRDAEAMKNIFVSELKTTHCDREGFPRG